MVVRASRPPDCVLRTDGRTADLDQHAAEQRATAAALAVFRGSGPGLGPAALTCRHGGSSTSESDSLDARGLTRRAETVRTDLIDTFGRLSLGGYAPGGLHHGHMPGSAHYEGRAIDVFFRPADVANRTRGWAMAQYLVARADLLKIKTVIFSDKIWTAGGRSDSGWRDYTPPERSGDPKILRHLDHVHVDVLEQ